MVKQIQIILQSSLGWLMVNATVGMFVISCELTPGRGYHQVHLLSSIDPIFILSSDNGLVGSS